MITSVMRNHDLTYQEPNVELMDRLVSNVTPMSKDGCAGTIECLEQDRGVCGRVEDSKDL